MIEELELQNIMDQYGTAYGQSVPSNFELAEKINEIIRYLNSKEDEK
jgi:hypothetical protein